MAIFKHPKLHARGFLSQPGSYSLKVHITMKNATSHGIKAQN